MAPVRVPLVSVGLKVVLCWPGPPGSSVVVPIVTLTPDAIWSFESNEDPWPELTVSAFPATTV